MQKKPPEQILEEIAAEADRIETMLMTAVGPRKWRLLTFMGRLLEVPLSLWERYEMWRCRRRWDRTFRR